MVVVLVAQHIYCVSLLSLRILTFRGRGVDELCTYGAVTRSGNEKLFLYTPACAKLDRFLLWLFFAVVFSGSGVPSLAAAAFGCTYTLGLELDSNVYSISVINHLCM